MYLKLKEDIIIDSNSIYSCELEESKIVIRVKYSEKPIEVFYKDTEILFIYENILKHFKAKDLTKNTKIKTKQEGEEVEKLFNKFWDTYDKKVGMQKCKQKFFRLNIDTMIKINEVAVEYVKKTPNVRYRKNPLTWLNGEHWNDDMSATESVKKQNFDIDNLF